VTHWLREPVVHFVVLGAAVFVVYALFADTPPPHSLTADDAPIAQLRSDWQARTGAPPSTAEEQRLRANWLEEEALYRRALELGLDESDTIVRRRLVQRMRFLIEDTTPVAEPDDARLREWINAHPGQYIEPALLFLDHVFFSR
jgi:peptidyl-prolyl cis-trans isomerase C